jgi:tRNA(fMet)-specific endonuclease VapC
MTGFLLDTDISSYIIKRRPATLVERFERHAESLNVSVITAAQLRFGAEKAGRPQLAALVEAYVERVAILDWTNDVTSQYARIRTELERAGKPIGNMDLLIAAHSVSRGMTLVTNNIKHFSCVPGLRVEVMRKCSVVDECRRPTQHHFVLIRRFPRSPAATEFHKTGPFRFNKAGCSRVLKL